MFTAVVFTIVNSGNDMETTYVLINRSRDKENVANIQL
jgi:hypothetical protein